MSKGRSIHIGINRVDPVHYSGWEGPLAGCEFDATDMAEREGFAPQVLLTPQATAGAVIGAIEAAAQDLAGGDILFLTYSGHGSQVQDDNGDEPDQRDETWVLYDRQLVDDELYSLWATFQPGVRIAVLSDSCHSGSALRTTLDGVRPASLGPLVESAGPATDAAERRMKVMPRRYQDKVYAENRELYDGIQASVPAGEKVEIGASALLISGCQDNQTSLDGDRNGLFTQTLKAVLADGGGRLGHRSLWKKVVARMPPWQTPNFMVVGQPNRAFERQRAFTVNP